MKIHVLSAVLAAIFMVNVSNVAADAKSETKSVDIKTQITELLKNAPSSTKTFVSNHKIAVGVVSVLATLIVMRYHCSWFKRVLGIVDEEDEMDDAQQEKMMKEFYESLTNKA